MEVGNEGLLSALFALFLRMGYSPESNSKCNGQQPGKVMRALGGMEGERGETLALALEVQGVRWARAWQGRGACCRCERGNLQGALRTVGLVLRRWRSLINVNNNDNDNSPSSTRGRAQLGIVQYRWSSNATTAVMLIRSVCTCQCIDVCFV